MDPDPGGPKTCGSGGSGTLVRRLCIICLLCVDGQQTWHVKWHGPRNGQDSIISISCGDIYCPGMEFILSIVECNKKTVSTVPLHECRLLTLRFLVQKSYFDKSSAWPRVELRFCLWLSVPIMCIASDGQWMKGSFRVIRVYSAIYVVNMIHKKEWDCTEVRLWSKYCALTYNDDRSFWAIDSRLTVSTCDSTYSKFPWVF